MNTNETANAYCVEDYQSLARRTQNPDLSLSNRFMHAMFGLASEVLEVIGLNPDEKESILDELGDVCWMLSELCDVYDIILPAKAANELPCDEAVSVEEGVTVVSYAAMKLFSSHQKVYQGHELTDVEKHITLALVGIRLAAEALGSSLAAVMKGNNDKLKNRYPNGFDAERSLHRNEE